MGTYDTRRLDVAIQYIRRMAEGRNPVTNRPAPENEVLINANVNRCLKFVEEILADVKSTGGVVSSTARTSRAQKPDISKLFPYEVLKGFQYVEDRQISRFLDQLGSLLPEGQEMPVRATMITNWLREKGYLEKRMMKDIGKENSVPTESGAALGLYAEKAGMAPNEYYRVFYNEKAQQFLVDNFEKILTETQSIPRKARSTRQQKTPGRQEGNMGLFAPVSGRESGSGKYTAETQTGKYPSGTQTGKYPAGTSVEKNPAGSYTGNRPFSRSSSGMSFAAGNFEKSVQAFDDDPAFASLVDSISSQQDAGYGDGGWDFGAMGNPDEGWENVDEGLPW